MCSQAIKTEDYKGHKIFIFQDEDPQDPRCDDNLTEFHVRDSNYYMGEHKHKNSAAIDEEVKKAKRQGDLVLDLFAYVHSGTFLSLESFYGRLPQGHAEYDSAQCGFVIIRRKKMLEEFHAKRWSPQLKAKALKAAENDVKTFTDYLNGYVYGYVIDDHADSCWGFYDDDAMTAAKEVIDFMVQNVPAEQG